jgi:hypothetical protein
MPATGEQHCEDRLHGCEAADHQPGDRHVTDLVGDKDRFASTRDGNSEIYVMNPDGTG